MDLTKQEFKRALSLQRRLKFLRWWDKVGRIFCYPWTCYQARRAQWHAELQVLYNKKFDRNLRKDVLDQYVNLNANPFLRLMAKRDYEKLTRMVKDMQMMACEMGATWPCG